MKNTYWTIEEEQFVKDNYLFMPYTQMAVKLNRTYKAVVNKVYKLKCFREKEIREQQSKTKTKKCYGCNQIKSFSEFHKCEGKSFNLYSYCKNCVSKRNQSPYYKQWRNNNIEIARAMSRKSSCRTRKVIMNIKMEVAQFFGCIICGEKRFQCLEFHHLDSHKKDKNVGCCKSIGRLIIEMKKCVVLCSNCHKLLHANIIELPECKPISYKFKNNFPDLAKFFKQRCYAT